jgi:hypothetical protein
MPISMYQASIPVFLRGFGTLSRLLAKGAEHAAQAGLDPARLTAARLSPDMLPLTGQVQRASDTAKLAAERLTGTPSPRLADEEATFDELQERIRRTVNYLESVGPESFEGSDTREVAFNAGSTQLRFTGSTYLLTFALPNFYFHLVTAYDILRHEGVSIGKRDYLGPYDTVS